MKQIKKARLLHLFILAAVFFTAAPLYPDNNDLQSVRILYPPDGASFPPNIAQPEFKWDGGSNKSVWQLEFKFNGETSPLRILTRDRSWTPDKTTWEEIKDRSKGGNVEFTVSTAPPVTFRISSHPLTGILVFRVLETKTDYPFREQILQTDIKHSLYYREIDSADNRLLFEVKGKTCIGCHYGAPNGKFFAAKKRLDTPDRKPIFVVNSLSPQDKQREIANLALNNYFIHVSPDSKKVVFSALEPEQPRTDGRKPPAKFHYFLFTNKDKQLNGSFLLAGGDICVYDLKTNEAKLLPGASDTDKVEIFGRWSSDGKTIAFVKREGINLEPLMEKNLTPDKKYFTGDYNLVLKHIGTSNIFTIPYNDGNGGEAAPLEGASYNSRSNSFPMYSPDGKWLAYCQSDGLDYVDESTDIYLVPGHGGKARYLECNSDTRDSWPVWSPDGRWLAFVSNRGGKKFAKIYITEINENGESTPAIILPNTEDDGKVYNHPYFMKKGW